MAIDSCGGIVNDYNMLEEMTSSKLKEILDSKLHSRTNKNMAIEILTKRQIIDKTTEGNEK